MTGAIAWYATDTDEAVGGMGVAADVGVETGAAAGAMAEAAAAHALPGFCISQPVM